MRQPRSAKMRDLFSLRRWWMPTSGRAQINSFLRIFTNLNKEN